jgi:hypothetical protein
VTSALTNGVNEVKEVGCPIYMGGDQTTMKDNMRHVNISIQIYLFQKLQLFTIAFTSIKFVIYFIYTYFRYPKVA